MQVLQNRCQVCKSKRGSLRGPGYRCMPTMEQTRQHARCQRRSCQDLLLTQLRGLYRLGELLGVGLRPTVGDAAAGHVVLWVGGF